MKRIMWINFIFLTIITNSVLASGAVSLNLKVLDENGNPISGAVVWYRQADARGRAWSSGLPNGYELRRSKNILMLCFCGGSDVRQSTQCNYSGPSLHPEDYFPNVQPGQEYWMNFKITKEGYQEIEDTFSWKINLMDICIYRTYVLRNIDVNAPLSRSSHIPALSSENSRAIVELIGPPNCQYVICYISHMREDYYKDYKFYTLNISAVPGETFFSKGERILEVDLHDYLARFSSSEAERIPAVVDYLIAPGNIVRGAECFLIPGRKTVIRIDEMGKPLSVEYK